MIVENVLTVVGIHKGRLGDAACGGVAQPRAINTSSSSKPHPEPKTHSPRCALLWGPLWVGCQAIVLGGGALLGAHALGALRAGLGDSPRWPAGESEVQYPAGGWCLEKKGN